MSADAPASRPRLAVRDLAIGTRHRTLVSGVDLTLDAGERVGLIGESGSGKSLTALAIMGLLPDNLHATGSIELTPEGGATTQVVGASDRAMSRIRGLDLSMVFQEPMSALNPTMRVGDQVAEVMEIHGTARGDAAARRAVELLESVGITDAEGVARAHPHQLSGGQRQRVVIAIALANDPDVLICDEPTTALDVTVQATVLRQVLDGAREHDAALLFITHDLAVVSQVCERVVVLKDGKVVERGTVAEVFGAPQHPYAQALVAASRLEPRDAGGATALDAVSPPPAAASPGATDPVKDAPAIAIEDARQVYTRPRRRLFSPPPQVVALDGVSLTIEPGERFGIVGESGSGKSTLLRLVAGLESPASGRVEVLGRQVSGVPERKLGWLRESVQMVFQDPRDSLDPRMTVRNVVAEPLVAQGWSGGDVDDRVAELLRRVGLEPSMMRRHPHQFSGGQRQRISIARALAPSPRVLLADEPVSALDVSVRGQVLDLIGELVDDLGLTLVFVSHDLSVVRHVCDRVAVMRRGELLEVAPTEELWAAPRTEYTRSLIEAIPRLVVPAA
ncbi:dipeptide ABC transporter ATP-binding protein [Kytococcus sedentarius]|uniref:dipeptide ABC transporter ATP-binding protein n=1 Tax=Kytococcus sedentarius TaxID=1276 RepID=UPI0035BC6D97